MKHKHLLGILLNRIESSYFKKYDISKKANTVMKLKTVFWLSLFGVSYVWYLQGLSGVALMCDVLLMGISLIGIALNIMHDANHDAYSSKKWVNTTLGYTMNIPVGLTSAGWKVQHNIDHHNETNIHGRDGDIEGGGLIRLTPEVPYSKKHKYQYIYAWFLYTLSTLGWVFWGDAKRFYAYCKREAIKPRVQVREWAILIGTKIVHIGLFILIPIFVIGYAWWIVLLAFVAMHMFVGLVTTSIFQLAHAVPVTKMLKKDAEKKSFLHHQLTTTANFAVDSKVLSWLIGGLNFQIEHHLMRNVCHVHYPYISPIVKEFCEEYDLPYNNLGSLPDAIKSHQAQLQTLGKSEMVSSAA